MLFLLTKNYTGVLNTFDGPLIGKSGQIGSPALNIEEPIVTSPELDLD